MAKKVTKRLREEVEKKGPRFQLTSVTENGKEGKSKMIASCGFLENELGVDLRTRVKKLGAKEKARRKKCKVRFSIIKKNKSLGKFHEKGCQEVAMCRHDAHTREKGQSSACTFHLDRANSSFR